MGDEDALFQDALNEHAEYLGMDPVRDAKYMYIAKEALEAPLPDG